MLSNFLVNSFQTRKCVSVKDVHPRHNINHQQAIFLKLVYHTHGAREIYLAKNQRIGAHDSRTTGLLVIRKWRRYLSTGCVFAEWELSSQLFKHDLVIYNALGGDLTTVKSITDTVAECQVIGKLVQQKTRGILIDID